MRKTLGNAENQTRGCWVRSKYVNYVQPPTAFAKNVMGMLVLTIKAISSFEIRTRGSWLRTTIATLILIACMTKRSRRLHRVNIQASHPAAPASQQCLKIEF